MNQDDKSLINDKSFFSAYEVKTSLQKRFEVEDILIQKTSESESLRFLTTHFADPKIVSLSWQKINSGFKCNVRISTIEFPYNNPFYESTAGKYKEIQKLTISLTSERIESLGYKVSFSTDSADKNMFVMTLIISE